MISLCGLLACSGERGGADAGAGGDGHQPSSDARADGDAEAVDGSSVDTCPGLGALADHTVGLVQHGEGAGTGYTLFAPLPSTETYLIDSCGRQVNSWDSDHRPACAAYLLPDGHLLRTAAAASASSYRFDDGGCAGGRIEEFDWGGELVWSFDFSGDDFRPHHDVARLPNGHIILIVWRSIDLAEAIEAGRDPSLIAAGELWVDSLVEIAPTPGGGGDIVWEWRVWDHLIQDFDSSKPDFGAPADHPERIDLNFAKHSNQDWIHINAVSYNAALDQLVLTVRNFDEIWVIDHSTSTTEAAGHSGGLSSRGGDLLYRWGNPATYRTGDSSAHRLFGPHDAHWISLGLQGAGHLLVFNNGAGRPGSAYSSVEEIVPPLSAEGDYLLVPGSAFDPATSIWQYLAPEPTDLYSQSLSGAQRLTNGNTLFCDGVHGTFFEVDAGGTVVWRYVNPVSRSGIVAQGDPVPSGSDGLTNRTFRALRYAPDYAGLVGRDLTPGAPIESEAGP